MHIDDVLLKLGKFGKYQMRIYFLLCLPAIPCGLHMLASVFIAAVPPDFRCAIPDYDGDTYKIQNSTHQELINAYIPSDDGKYDSCNIHKDVDMATAALLRQQNVTFNRTKCQKWVYDESLFTETIITQFDLVCDQSGQATVATVIFMAGVLVGAFIFGILSDVIGRKKTLLIAIFLQAGGGIGCAFSPNYVVFVILRFVIAAGNMGIFMTAFVIGMELMVPSMRLFAGIVIEYFFALGYLLLTLVAYFVRDWMWIQIIISAPSFLFLSYAIFVPESYRWLGARGRTEEAEKILRHAAKVNGVTLPSESLFAEEKEEEKGETLALSQLPGQLFKAPTLLIRTMIIFFNWLVVAMVYYGLSLNSGNLGGDIFVNFMLSGLVEFPAYTFCFACKCLGRKGPHAANMILGGVACISTVFIVLYLNSDNTWLVTLSMIGKFGATVGFAIIYFWSAEIYPTVCRNGLMGMSSMFGRVGSMAAAPIADLGKLVGGSFGAALPQIVFGGMTILAGVLSLLLPETTNKELPETIAEGNNFGKKQPKKSDVYLVETYKRKDADEYAYNNPAVTKTVDDTAM